MISATSVDAPGADAVYKLRMSRRLLLLSTSTVHGTQYLEHAVSEFRDFLGATRRVLFLPYALADPGAYAAKARAAFEAMGYALDSIHESAAPKQAIETAEAIFCGGGNSFRLLDALQRNDLLGLIRRRVSGGLPYSGASAGSNVACPTIRTTNDMPIVEPASLHALGLVAFQINPHYVDPDPGSRHMGETREERLLQFHEENQAPVVGLREGALLRVTGPSVLLRGLAGARIFRRGEPPVEAPPGTALESLLS